MKEYSKKSNVKDLFVKSLDEYVKLLNHYPSREFFFRGENGSYPEREAGAFREHHGGWVEKYRDFMEMVNNFYKEVSYRIDNAEKSHFLAFSQHYGIPTNLIDVSTSPLTALFFACNGNKPEGYVYIFDKEYIDITPIIMRNPKTNFIELMLEKDAYTISAFINEMHRFETLYPKTFITLYDNLILDIKHYLSLSLDKSNPIKKLKTYKRKQGVYDAYLHDNASIALEINAEHEYIDLANISIDILSSAAVAYTILSIHLIKRLHEYEEYLFWLNWLPSMIYKPDILFERARIQNGFFIVQAFMHHTEPMYEVDVLARQRIMYARKIKIEESSKVLRELDNIGINRATIFEDFDNIANHIVTVHRGA